MDTVIVTMGDLYATAQPERITTFGIGSCIVMVLYDKEKRIGGLMHAMLSAEHASALQVQTHPLRYISTAMEALINALERLGARTHHLQAHLIGGAQMFATYREGSVPIGIANVANATSLLDAHHITIITNATGGTEGKNVSFDVQTGVLEVTGHSSTKQYS